MVKKRQKRYLIPQNLDLKLLCEGINPTTYMRERRKFDLEKLLKVIDSLYRLKANPRKNKYATDNFTPIKLEYLRKSVPDAEHYLNYLLAANVLVKDKVYIKGLKAYGYKFNSPFYGTPSVYTLGLNLESNTSIEFLGFDLNSKKLPHLYKWFNEKLVINVAGALKESFKTYWQLDGEQLPIYFDDIDFSSVTKIGISRRSEKFTSMSHSDAFNSLLGGLIIPLSTYENKEYYFKVDTSGFRLHTNLTNLKKTLRKYVTYAGMQMVAFDIKNSQPFFLNVLLDLKFWSNQESTGNFNIKSIRDPSGTLRGLTRRKAGHPLTMRAIINSEYSSTFELFKKITIDGTLYEFIEQKYLEGTGEMLTRNEIKHQLITLIYDTSKKYRKYVYDIEETVEANLPGLMDFCNLFKSKKAHNGLALILQNIESTVVLRLVAKSIAQKHPKMPLFTVHDSLVTTVDYAPVLGALIASEIASVVGFSPTIKEEPWF